MIRPRFVARFCAWLFGYFWLPCPVCKEPFAGFEASLTGYGVMASDGRWYCHCPKPGCVKEAQRRYLETAQPLIVSLQ